MFGIETLTSTSATAGVLAGSKAGSWPVSRFCRALVANRNHCRHSGTHDGTKMAPHLRYVIVPFAFLIFLQFLEDEWRWHDWPQNGAANCHAAGCCFSLQCLEGVASLLAEACLQIVSIFTWWQCEGSGMKRFHAAVIHKVHWGSWTTQS